MSKDSCARYYQKKPQKQRKDSNNSPKPSPAYLMYAPN